MDTRDSLLYSYNQAADVYTDAFYHELQKKPFDLNLLNQFKNQLTTGSRVCDLGCGPGHVTAYLAHIGLEPTGLDLSKNMICIAKEKNPSIPFETGDMMNLSFPDKIFNGITAFYSIIHTEPGLLGNIFNEMYRVLASEGILLITCHVGTGEIQMDNWFEQGVKYHCYLHRPEELTKELSMAGFKDIRIQVRKPYEFEFETERMYIFAKKE